MSRTHSDLIPFDRPAHGAFSPMHGHAAATLTPSQVQRFVALGRTRAVSPGEVLLEAGARPTAFYVVVCGRVDGRLVSAAHAVSVIMLGPGMFTGEITMLSGGRGLVELRVIEAGEVVEVSRADLLNLIQTDAELGEIIIRAFVLRRAAFVANGSGDTVVLGSSYCGGTLRVREFLGRNGHPYTMLDLDRDAGVQELLDRLDVKPADIPVVICRGEVVLRNPDIRRIADCLGLNNDVDPGRLWDLAVVGAGPAGLAAAVYGASEGLGVIVLEAIASGGQAGTSSRIENYLGFPTGISGGELADRAHNQALKFGAEFMIAAAARRLDCSQRPYALEMEDGSRVLARTVIIATGARYRRLPLEGLDRFEGAGVYYAATRMEAQLCSAEEVVVIGGGNSAGQAAVFLADTASRVHMLIRSTGLAQTMSRYLIRRIEEHPRVVRHVCTEVVGLEGERHLQHVAWRDNRTGQLERHPVRHVFSMTGAVPGTGWLGGCVAVDGTGFVKTGVDLTPEDLASTGWSAARAPHLLETNRPGVFAVGDVRAGSLKRVASAVGEGSVAIAAVHQVLGQ